MCIHTYFKFFIDFVITTHFIVTHTTIITIITTCKMAIFIRIVAIRLLILV